MVLTSESEKADANKEFAFDLGAPNDLGALPFLPKEPTIPCHSTKCAMKQRRLLLQE